MKLHTYFHWAFYKFGWKHRYNLGTGLFIWLFLLLTRPFGVYATDLNHFFKLALFLLPVGISFILITYLVDFIARSLLKINLSSNPSIDGISWLVKLILFVHLIYLIRLIRCEWQCLEMLDYLEQWFAFILLLLLTYIPLAFYGRSKFFHSLIGHDQKVKDSFMLAGEGNEKLLINLRELMLLKADDNYVDLYFITPETPTRKTIRATLTSISEQLSSFPQFQRVHRSFIVNLHYTSKRSFNTLTVKNDDWSIDVPLSPTFRESLRPLLS